MGRDADDGHGHGTVLVIPDLCHADLLADDRFGRHGGAVLPFYRPQHSNGQKPAEAQRQARRQRSARRPERSAYWLCPKVPGGMARRALRDVKNRTGPRQTRRSTLHQPEDSRYWSRRPSVPTCRPDTRRDDEKRSVWATFRAATDSPLEKTHD